jgi:hypothetical protein
MTRRSNIPVIYPGTIAAMRRATWVLTTVAACGPLEEGHGGVRGSAAWAVREAMPQAREWDEAAAVTFAYCGDEWAFQCPRGIGPAWVVQFVADGAGWQALVGEDGFESGEEYGVREQIPIEGWEVDSPAAAQAADLEGDPVFELSADSGAPAWLVTDCAEWASVDATTGEVLGRGEGGCISM